MEFSVWLAFVVASTIVLISPGSTTFYPISLALRDGRKNALYASLGVALGDLVAITLAVIGLGILLTTSLFFFTLLKVIGGLYLVYLGFKTIRNASRVGREYDQSKNSERLESFLKSALITVLNPKSIMFFVAFVPLFIDESSSYSAQAFIIVSTFVALGFLNAMIYSFLVSYLKDVFLNGKVIVILNRIVGGVIVIFGLGLLAYNRSQ